jgi:hypothetical protein
MQENADRRKRAPETYPKSLVARNKGFISKLW